MCSYVSPQHTADATHVQLGAFLSTASTCVPVDYPSDPVPPFVAVCAPDVVGTCDDLMLEGMASYTSAGKLCTAYEGEHQAEMSPSCSP